MPKISKFFTFGLTFQNYCIDSSVCFPCKFSKIFCFSFIFQRRQNSPNFRWLIKLFQASLHPSHIVSDRRPIFPYHSKIFGPDGPTFSRKIEDLALVRSHPKCCIMQSRRPALRLDKQSKKRPVRNFLSENFQKFTFFH